MKKWICMCLLAVLFAGCSEEANQPDNTEENEHNEENENEEEAENDTENEVETKDNSESAADLEIEYYEIEDPPRELTDLEESLLRYPGPYSGEDFNLDHVMEEVEDISAETAEDWSEGILALIHDSYYEEIEQILEFDPTIEIESETPEEEMPEGEELPATSHFAILLDASGSMNAENETGTRMDEAKEAIEEFVDSLPEGSSMSLRVYGHEGSNLNEDKELSCSITEVVYEGEADSAALKEQLDEVEANGWTPLARAIEESEQDIPENTTDAIVYVVSDGIETCDGDPVEATTQLVEHDINPIINIIGFQVDEEDHQLLMDVAAAGNGEFSYVDSKQELTDYWTEEYNRMMQAWDDWQTEELERIDELSSELMDEADEFGQSIMDKADTEFENAELVIEQLSAEGVFDYDMESSVWGLFYDRKTSVWGYGYDMYVENWSAAYTQGVDIWTEVYELGTEKWTEYYRKLTD